MPRRPRALSGQRGQILIPSLFVLPSLMLFVYLIFETAKLSREKIRHQFAVDAASFIEMTNYSDFLNRSAYVNGAFPQRIFAEGFLNTWIDRKNNTVPDRLYDILWRNGDFPGVPGGSAGNPEAPLDNVPVWPILFDPSNPTCGLPKDVNPPDVAACQFTGGVGPNPSPNPQPGGGNAHLDILTLQNAIDYWLSWDDANDIYNLYVQIYSLLGSVEDAQYSVWQRLSGTDHNFFRKSYWLNTADAPANSDPRDGAALFSLRSFNPKAYCIQELMFYGNKPTSNPFQPYQIWAPERPVVMNSTMSTQPNACSPNGLFHLEAVPQSDLNDMNTPHDIAGYPGYNVIQGYSTWTDKGNPPNYFNVNFDALMGGDPVCEGGGNPCVHATVNLSGGSLWPNPTPKFQTRLYP